MAGRSAQSLLTRLREIFDLPLTQSIGEELTRFVSYYLMGPLSAGSPRRKVSGQISQEPLNRRKLAARDQRKRGSS